MSSTRRVALLLFAGSFLIQLAWIISLPPFRGIDEFDHAYRAAAVAHGQWIAGRDAELEGRGSYVQVPRSLVEAARPECYTYEYTGYANCNPMRKLGHGYVTVASAAASYNPVFYWIVGTPAKFFGGATSLFVMRMVASLISSAMIAIVGWIVTLWARTNWPLVGVLVGLTPVVMYGTALPAPNAVEMLGGLGLWAALIGLSRADGNPSLERRLLGAAMMMALPVVFVRSLGPLWLAMIVFSMFAYLGWEPVKGILTRNRKAVAIQGGAVAAVAIAGIAWSLASSTNAPSTELPAHYTGAFKNSLPQLYLWVFQSFAAFPTRAEFPPLWVFACGFTVFALFLVVAFRLAGRRLRVLMVGVAVASLLVPFAITLGTYSSLGTAWQGRYTLPYALGLPLIAGTTLELSHSRLPFVRPTLVGGIFLYLAAHIGGTLYVLDLERKQSPLVGTHEWWVPPTWLVVSLISAAFAAWTLSTRVAARRATAFNQFSAERLELEHV